MPNPPAINAKSPAARTAETNPASRKRRSARPALLSLPLNLDMRAAPALAQLLLAERGRAVQLDASSVQKLGAQCLQVLLAGRATWASDGQNWKIVAPSQEFCEGVAALGAADLTAPAEHAL